MKRIFALVLAAAMILAMVPMTAMATTGISTEAELRAAAENGGDVALLNDIELTTSLLVADKLTIDLNGHKITDATSWDNEADSTEIGYKAGANNKIYDALIIVRRGGELTVRDCIGGGKIEAKNVDYAIKMTLTRDPITDTSKAAKLTVESGEITAGTYAISGNGNPDRVNTEILVTGGKVHGGAAGIYHPQDGKITIGGDAKVSGTNSGIEIRAGKLEVCADAEISASAPYQNPAPNGSGTTMTGVALAISQHKRGTEDMPIEVIINGGTFKGEKALYEDIVRSDASDNGTPSKVKISIHDGEFQGDVQSENKEEFIMGGTFNANLHQEAILDGTMIAGVVADDVVWIGATAEEEIAKAAAGKEIIVAVSENNTLTVAPGVKLTNLTDHDLTVNGQKVASGATVTIPGINESAPIPETGDGMGLFVFAGLALISMLGMAMMKKREEY